MIIQTPTDKEVNAIFEAWVRGTANKEPFFGTDRTARPVRLSGDGPPMTLWQRIVFRASLTLEGWALWLRQ